MSCHTSGRSDRLPGAVDISVVVPCRNEGEYIKTTIRRITEQRGVGEHFTFEILVLDGNSTDNTADIVREESRTHNAVTLIRNDKRVTPAAFNLGIERSRGKYICILGAHCEIEEDYLENCLSVIERENADNVGGPWRAKGYGYVGEAIAIAFQSPFAIGGALSHQLSFNGRVDSVWGGFYRRSVFDRIGLFDEELIRNQDDELNLRLVEAKGIIWQSTEIRYTYVCRNSLRLLLRQYFQYGYWKIRVMQKHPGLIAPRHILPGLFLLGLMALTAAALIAPSAAVVLGFVLAVYLAFLLLGSALGSFGKRTFRYFPVLPLVLSCFHLGYGAGSLKGLWDFVIFRRHRNHPVNDSRLSR